MAHQDFVYFGSAVGELPQGIEPQDMTPDVVTRKRPEQYGEDVVKFGRRGQTFGGTVIVFGSTYSDCEWELRVWEREKGQIRDLTRTWSYGYQVYTGCVLMEVRAFGPPRRIYLATNDANYAQYIQVFFKRVAYSTPA